MSETPTKPLISVKELADLLDKSENVVYKRVKNNSIPEALIVRSGRKIEFRRVAVLRWLEGELAA